MRAWMKERREEMGLTLRQAGEAIGVSESYYKLIEDGNRQKTLDLSTAQRIGELLGLTLPQISALEDSNPQSPTVDELLKEEA